MHGWKTILSIIFTSELLSVREGNIQRVHWNGTLGRELHAPAPMVNDWSSMELSTKHAGHTTTLSKPHLELLICPAIGWRLIHLPKSYQMNILWHPWAHLDLRNCCRRAVYFIELNTVRRQQFRRSRWAQGCKADSGHRLFIYYPKWRLIHLPKSQLAANAPCVAWICCTYLSWSWTAELSPPHPWSPQVTTDPSAKIATQMRHVWPESAAHTLPQVTTDPSAKIAANARCVTVAAKACITPGHDGSICKNMLYSPELILNRRTVAAKACITPGDDCGSMRPRGKSLFCCCNLWLNYQSCNALSVLSLCFF